MMQEITVQNGQPAPELIHDIMKHKACGIRQEYNCYICLDGHFIPGSKVEKPYVLTRSKIDFTMEDLENATEEEDDFSPNLSDLENATEEEDDFSPNVSVPDISERLQFNRSCKRDLFLNQ